MTMRPQPMSSLGELTLTQDRLLGDTGLHVSRIGLGLAALGRPGYINVGHGKDLASREVGVMRHQTHRVLDAAWAGGVCYLDAARSYGRAEEFLGSWLRDRGIHPDQATVGSKWGYTYTADWRVDAPTHEVKDHSLGVFRRQRAETRAQLGPYLSLYQIHSATLDSGVLKDEGVHAALAELRDDGIRIGLSLSGPGQAEALRRAMNLHWEGKRLFDVVQATWNLLEPSAGPALSEASQSGMGVIVKEALANGRLTDRNQDSGFASQMRVLRREAERLGVGIDALALAAALEQPWADVVLSGAATVEQIRANLRALKFAPGGDVTRELRGLAEPSAEYWARRSALPWS